MNGNEVLKPTRTRTRTRTRTTSEVNINATKDGSGKTSHLKRAKMLWRTNWFDYYEKITAKARTPNLRAVNHTSSSSINFPLTIINSDYDPDPIKNKVETESQNKGEEEIILYNKAGPIKNEEEEKKATQGTVNLKRKEKHEIATHKK